LLWAVVYGNSAVAVAALENFIKHICRTKDAFELPHVCTHRD